jgi:hypothetical protein
MKTVLASVLAIALMGASAASAAGIRVGDVHIGVGGHHHHRHCSAWGWHNHHHDRFCRTWG